MIETHVDCSASCGGGIGKPVVTVPCGHSCEGLCLSSIAGGASAAGEGATLPPRAAGLPGFLLAPCWFSHRITSWSAGAASAPRSPREDSGMCLCQSQVLKPHGLGGGRRGWEKGTATQASAPRNPPSTVCPNIVSLPFCPAR